MYFFYLIVNFLVKKRMIALVDAVAISCSNGKICEFFEFANDIHNMSECDKANCDIFKFLKPLEEALSDETCCHHQETVFLNQCLKYTNVFDSMFKLSKSEGVKATLEELKKKKLECHRSKGNRKKLLKNLMEQLNLSKNLGECNFFI